MEPKSHSVDNSTFFRPLVCCLIVVLQFLSEHSHGHDNRDDIGCLQTTKYNKQSLYIYILYIHEYIYLYIVHTATLPNMPNRHKEGAGFSRTPC